MAPDRRVPNNTSNKECYAKKMKNFQKHKKIDLKRRRPSPRQASKVLSLSHEYSTRAHALFRLNMRLTKHSREQVRVCLICWCQPPPLPEVGLIQPLVITLGCRACATNIRLPQMDQLLCTRPSGEAVLWKRGEVQPCDCSDRSLSICLFPSRMCRTHQIKLGYAICLFFIPFSICLSFIG